MRTLKPLSHIYLEGGLEKEFKDQTPRMVHKAQQALNKQLP